MLSMKKMLLVAGLLWLPQFDQLLSDLQSRIAAAPQVATAAPHLPPAAQARFRAEVAADQEELAALLATRVDVVLSR